METISEWRKRRHRTALALAEILELAQDDAWRAKAKGVDLNPFTTPSARALWWYGWNNVWPLNQTTGSPNWRSWYRGRCAKLISTE